ncbi:MAG: hypothetical protein AAF939_22830 [Planctomycetota bacterium]
MKLQVVAMTTILFLTCGLLCHAQSQSKQNGPLKVGDQITPFKLTSLDDEVIDSSEQFGRSGRPAVLLFSRAHW